jgi:hypothetical protein
MKKNQDASQDELITALFYLYQEALKKNVRLAAAIQTAIETGEKLGPSTPPSETRQDILKQFYVLREFQKLDEAQKQLFIQEIDGFQAKAEDKGRSPGKRKSKRTV